MTCNLALKAATEKGFRIKISHFKSLGL
jgi:hypothetical protein